MPIAIATSARKASANRAAWRLMAGSRPEEHDDRAAAAVHRARLHEGEHLVAARKELADAALEHRLPASRAQALAVDDPHAAQSAPAGVGEEARRLERRLVGGEAVQVELVLDHPVRAPELSQDVARKAGPQEERIVLELDVVAVGAEPRELLEHRALVAK